MNVISSVTDSPRPGQTQPVVTPEGIAAVEAIVKENRRLTVNEIAARLDTSHGSAHQIVHDVMQFHKVFNKLRDKKLVRFPFDSPSYFHKGGQTFCTPCCSTDLCTLSLFRKHWQSWTVYGDVLTWMTSKIVLQLTVCWSCISCPFLAWLQKATFFEASRMVPCYKSVVFALLFLHKSHWATVAK